MNFREFFDYLPVTIQDIAITNSLKHAKYHFHNIRTCVTEVCSEADLYPDKYFNANVGQFFMLLITIAFFFRKQQ